MKTGIKKIKRSILIKSFLLRCAIFAAGWIILVGGQQISDLWFVILCIAATAGISIYTIPPGQWVLRPLGVVLFLPYFLITAIRGGWDVARRVFFRTIPIDPDFISIEHDRDPRKTLVLAWVISLLPGTASTVIREDSIVVHVLDKNLPVTEEIRELQHRINKIFVTG
ncbi:MAG: Na+/H+ antiporter subunit E [Bacteroidales bacterium]|nr:Na+/H+ antiporter subunit E [Bacteroidales bacterium]